MLNKEVCKKCINKYRTKIIPNENKSYSFKIIDWKWNKEDDIYWEREILVCPIDILSTKLSVNKTLKKNQTYNHCRFKLEHILKEN
jgi:hypothetical protein